MGVGQFPIVRIYSYWKAGAGNLFGNFCRKRKSDSILPIRSNPFCIVDNVVFGYTGQSRQLIIDIRRKIQRRKSDRFCLFCLWSRLNYCQNDGWLAYQFRAGCTGRERSENLNYYIKYHINWDTGPRNRYISLSCLPIISKWSPEGPQDEEGSLCENPEWMSPGGGFSVSLF